MDPNTLSIEEGKKILRQFGIPQGDIDMMTEKWEVVASVEVLFKYPLLPGEDPTARCISNKKSQPAAYQPNSPSQKQDQGERKCNNQSMTNIVKKPNVMKQMASNCIQPPSQRPTGDKTQKKKCFKAMNPRNPPQKEEETKVKCKNCGAFGHTAGSRLCPMKRWQEALPVQPLGSNKEKENLKTSDAQLFQTPEMFKMTEREKKEEQRQEVVSKKTVSQRFPRSSPKKSCSEEPKESCFPVKCKNCGAFGHTAGSRLCPMKRWQEALPVQPLGSNKEKENLKTSDAQLFQTPEMFKMTEREKKEEQRQEVVSKKTVSQRFPRSSPKKSCSEEPKESCFPVKCKNCGAFGHTAGSRLCPMKRWQEALPVQPLGSNKEKENLKTSDAQLFQTPEMFKMTEREKKEEQRQEVVSKKTVSQRFPRSSPKKSCSEEPKESCFPVKCKNCGAFGHTAGSRLCPMKRWQEALPVQPLGSNKEKENLKTSDAQLFQTPEMFKMTEREKKEEQRQEVVSKKTVSQRFPRSSPKKSCSEEPKESCFPVKCKNCGAFGHTAGSRLCPMKRWQEALPVQPLGSNKEKENLKTSDAQLFQTPEMFKMTEREKKEEQRQEVVSKKTVSQRFPRSSPKKSCSEEPKESCFPVKCKNCGAFGHTAGSRLCPMKRWQEALPVQPLGSNKKKENLKTSDAQLFQTPEMFKMTEREKKEEQRQEVVSKKTVSQRFPRSSPKKSCSEEPKESCFPKPTRPMLNITKKKTSLGPVSKGPMPVKTPDMRATPSSYSYNKAPEVRTYRSVESHDMVFSDTQKPNLRNFQDSHPSSKKISPGSVVSLKCALQPDTKTPLLIHDTKVPTGMKHPGMESQPSVQSMRPKRGQEPKGSIQHPRKKPRISSSLNPTLTSRVPEWETAQVSQVSLTTNGCHIQQSPKINPNKQALKASVHRQTLHCASYSSPTKDTTVSQNTHSDKHKIPISLKTDKQQPDFGTKLFLMSKSPTKTDSVSQSNLNLKDSFILGSNATRSVLYEDLLLSSSSEDSDE